MRAHGVGGHPREKSKDGKTQCGVGVVEQH